MKKLMKLLLLSPVVFLSMSCANNDEPKEPIPVDVVVISGQSNGVGSFGSSLFAQLILKNTTGERSNNFINFFILI